MRRAVAAIAISILALLGAPAATAGAQGDDNQAVAINTQDGASVFRLALSVRMVADGVVDQTNTAVALASCTDCQTVALAFQVVLVRGDADIVIPENQAVAFNDQCVLCVTYASATQIVLGFDGHVRLSGDGRRRLVELYLGLRGLEDRIAELSVAELDAEVQAAKQELVDILSTELVENPPGGSGPSEETTTTSSTSTSSSTTVAGSDAETTTTTGEEPTTTTSTTAPPETTTSTSADTTTTTAP